MKLGAERNKILVLLLLLGVAGFLFWQQFLSGPETKTPSRATRPATPSGAARSAADDIIDSRTPARTRAARSASIEFKPSLKKSKPGEGPDPLKLDPTLRTDLLAKVRAVESSGVERNLFQFGVAKPKVTPEELAAVKRQAAEAEAKANGPSSAEPPKPSEPVAPPVPMKYYGYASRPGDARRRAFLIDGEEIIVAVEGEVIKKRYRIVRIGVGSLVVEDLQFRSQQTVPLQES